MPEHKLYDLGYQVIKDPALLEQVALKLDAVVLDIRFSPRARDFRWNGAALARRLVERYVHVKALGNVNYKNGGPIEITDLPAGLAQITHYLQTNSVILLCACAARATCHRLVVADAFRQAGGVASHPLNLAECQAIGGAYGMQEKLL